MTESDYEILVIIGLAFLGFFGVCSWVLLIHKMYRDITRMHAYNRNNRDDHVIITIKESIPVVDFSYQDFEDTEGVECVVCLAELANGDKVKFLPTCNHCFHADCIDSWFRSHSTCPTCRCRLGSMPELGNSDESLTQNLDILTSSQHLGSPTAACG